MILRPMVWALATNLLIGTAVMARAEGPALHPHEKLNNWGKWGDADERGAANYITPERIVAAGRLIQTGKTFSLAIPLDSKGPVFPPRLPPASTLCQ